MADERTPCAERIRTTSERLVTADRHQRHRLARILHDDLQQVLYAVHMRLSLARTGGVGQAAQEDTHDQIDSSLALLEQAMAKTREVTLSLGPHWLENERVVTALGLLKPHMQDVHDLVVDLNGDPSIRLVSPEILDLLFQVVLELLFNVAVHAGAKRAVIDVQRFESGLRVTVTDEGVGFDVETSTLGGGGGAGVGLWSARERLRLHGGDLEISSTRGLGTRVTVYTPADSDPPPSM